MKRTNLLGIAGGVLLLFASTTQALDNFWWIQNSDGVWSDGNNWINDFSSSIGPTAGGFQNYALIFQTTTNGGITVINDIGQPDFLLNQLQFVSGSGGVTIFGGAGTNLVFTNDLASNPPSLVNDSANGGVLNIGINLANDTTFGGTGSGLVLVNSNISGAGGLIKEGAYELRLTAANSYTGPTTVNTGLLQINNANGLSTNTATINSGGTLFLNVAGTTVTFTNTAISGAGTLRVSTPGTGSSSTLLSDNLSGFTGTLDIVASNGVGGKVNQSYAALYPSGTATVKVESNATLFVNGGGVFGSAIQLYGGTMGENLGQLRVEGNTTVSNTVMLMANTAIGGNSGGYISGMLTDNGANYSLVKWGSGTMTLLASNTIGGGWTLNAGMLAISNASALGNGTVVMNGGALSNMLNNAVITNAIVLQAAGTLSGLPGGTTTFGGPITGTGALTVYGGYTNQIGVVQLLGNNTFSGNFTIGAGQVVITNAAGLGVGNKTVTITGQGNSMPTTLVLVGAGGDVVLGSNFSFTTSYSGGAISNASGNNIINGSFSLVGGGGNTLIVAGGGTLTINGNITNNYTGVRGLVLGGVATGTINGLIRDGINFTNQTSLTKQDGGLWIIAGNNDYSVGTTIMGGTLQVGNGGTSGTLGINAYSNLVYVTNGTRLVFNRADAGYVVNNVISGTGQVIQTGSGYLTLAGTNNSYAGGTVINNGTLGFATVGAVGGVGANITNNLGGAIAAAGAYTNVMGWLASGRIATSSLGAMALVSNSAETINFNGAYSNLSLGAAAGTYDIYSGAYTPVANNYGVQNYNLGGGGGTLVFAPTIASGNVTVNAPGLVLLSGLNSYAGGTVISNGELGISLDANIGGYTSAITIAGGVLGINGAALHNLGGHAVNWTSFNGGVDVVSPFNAVVVGTNISGSGSLSKLGKGYLLLQGGANTYSGGTTVSNGTLRLLQGGGNNQLATNGAITSVGGTLDFAGSSQTTANAISFQGGMVQNGTLINAGSADFDGRAGIVAANLQSGGSLTKSTTGTLTLLGNNTYLINNINAGTLAIVSDVNLGGAGSVINFSGGTLQVLGTALNNIDRHTVSWNNAPVSFDIAQLTNAFIIGSIIGGNSSLTKVGSGVLVLTNANIYSGLTTINAGTLQIGNGGTSGTLGVGPVSNFSALAFNRTDTITVPNSIAGNGTLIKNGTGALILAGTNTYSGATMVNAGSLAIAAGSSNAIGSVTVSGGGMLVAVTNNGIMSLGANNLTVGAANNDRSVVVLNSGSVFTNTTGKIYVGSGSGAAGAIIQNGGSASFGTGQTSSDFLTLGYSGGYGYYQMNSGTLIAGQLGAAGSAAGGTGVFDLNNGTVTVNGGWLLAGGWAAGNQKGVFNLFGGTMIGPAANPVTMGVFANEGAYGMFNLLGSNAVLIATNNANGVNMMGGANNNNSVFNLNAGTLIASRVYQAAGGSAQFNFNGGTLKAGANNMTMALSTNGSALIYSGGAILDTTNFTMTISQGLLAPTGYGVTNVAFTAGAGYIGTPFVLLTGGSGTGATAVAQVNFAAGVITNILITSAGFGYQSNDVLMATLYGGGATTPATLGTVQLGVNTNSGGLTKLGSGVLTLSGTNTYGGGTIISGGLVNFTTASSLPSAGSVTIGNGAALAVNGPYTNVAGWLGSGRIAADGSYGALALVSNSTENISFTGGYGNLALGAAPGLVYFTGTLTPNNWSYRLGGGGGILVITNDSAFTGTDVLKIGNAYGLPGTVYLEGSNPSFIGGTELYPGAILSLDAANSLGTGWLTLNGGTLQVRGSSLNSLNLNPAMTGSNIFDISYAGNSFNIANNLTVAGNLTKTGLGTLVLSGSNTFNNGSVTVAGGALNLQNNNVLGGVSNITVASGAGEIQLQGNISITNTATLVGGGAFVNDGALRNISGTNTWAGLIVQTGATRYNSDNGQLVIAGTLNNGNAAVVVGGNSDTLISGTITNTGALTKDGGGRLILTGTNTYTGATTVNAGGLVLDFSATNAPANNIIAPSSTLSLNSGGSPSTLTVIGSASGVNTQTFANSTAFNGYSAIIASNNGNALVLNLNGLSANANYLVDFTLPTLGAINVTNATINGLLQFATVGGVDFATTIGGAVTNYTAYMVPTTTLVSNNTSNVQINTNSSPTVTLGGSTIINNLVANDSTQAHTLTLGGNRLQLNGGTAGNPGVLMQAIGSGGLTVGSSNNDGIVTSGSWLFFVNNSASNLTINSAVNNGGNYVSTFGVGPIIFNGTNNGSGQFAFNGGGTVTFNNTNVLTGAILVRGGTVNLAPTSSNTFASTVSVTGGQVGSLLNIYGLTAINVNNFQIGNAASDRARAVITTNMSAYQIQTGYGNTTAAGALFLNGGTVLLTRTGDNDDSFSVGSSALGAYGYFNMTGGVLTNVQRFEVGENGGNGVMDMSGGVVTSPNTYVLLGRGNQGTGTNYGIVNISGGAFYGSPIHETRLNNDAATTSKGSIGIVTISGSGLFYAAAPTNTTFWMDLMYGAGNVGILNLNGGTTVVNQIKATAAGTSVLNFNGGRLVANLGTILSNNFIQNLSGAYVYSGGAVIDTTSNNLIVGQSLIAPSGYGITNIALANNGGGYIGAPIVAISGGSGIGATAIAQIDFTTGSVTNILITSAGSGYLPNDAVNIQLIGGGYTNAAKLGAMTLVPNANNGGLTKFGAGMLTLTGTNTYRGTSVINEGTLVFQPSVVTTNSIGGLGGSGVMQHNGLGVTILNGSSAGFTGSATVNTGLVQIANAGAALPSGTLLVNNGAAVSFDFGEGSVQSALASLNTNSVGSVALTAKSVGESINFASAGLTSAYLGAVDTIPYDLTKHIPAVAGTWRLGGGPGTLVITNGISSGNALIVGGGSGVVQAGSSYNLSALTVNTASTFNVAGNSQVIGALTGSGYINNSTAILASLTIGMDNTNVTYFGNISGSNSLTKAGAGNQLLGGFYTYVGPTLVSNGTLGLLASATLNSTIMITNGATLLASGSSTNLQGQFYYNAVYLAPDPSFNSISTINSHFAGINPNAIAVGSLLSSSNFDFGSTGLGFPAPFTTGALNFEGKWAGKFNATTNGLYMFGLSSDDASLLYIDGNIVVNRNAAGGYVAGPPGQATGLVQLTPGLHEIVIVFAQQTGGYGLTAYEANPGGTTNILSSSLLSFGPTINTLSGDYGTTVALSNSLLTVNQLTDTGFNGNLTNYTASDMLFKTGLGILTLGGTNTAYTGGITVNGGVLMFGTNTALTAGAAGSSMINFNGAMAFNFAGIQNWLTNINPWSAGTIALTGNSAAANLDFNTLNLSNVYLGAVGNVSFTGTYTNFGTVTRLGGGGGTLTMVNPITSGSVAIGGGLGTVVLTNTLNSYTGTVINAGTLQIGFDAALGFIPVTPTTNITFAGNSTLQAGASGLTLTNNRTLLVNTGVTGSLDDNGTTFTINGALNGAGTLAKIGSGTLVVNAITNTIGTFNVRSGIVSNGAPVVFTGNINLGSATNDRAVMAVTSDFIANQFLFGAAASNAGAIYQSGGLLKQTAASGANNFQLGAGIGSYGYFKITGGTNIAAETEVGGANGGYGVFEIYGGLVSNTSYFLPSRTAQATSPGGGVVNLFGGTLALNGIANRFNFIDQGQPNQFGALSVFNNALLNAGAKDLGLNQANQGTGTVIINLNGGTTIVGRIVGQGGATQVVNFSGGVLKAGASSTTFFQGATAGLVFQSGAVVDDGGFAITINQNLLAPTGYGVTNVALANGGTNYIGAPIVELTGGSGIGASAIAQIDAHGVITNILVTSAGTGYLSNDVLTASLFGGGAVSNAVLGTVQLGANNSSGGSLTKYGAGTLSLGGTNTYNGATIVSSGNLQIGSGGTSGSLVNSNVVFSNNASWLGFNRSDQYTNSIAVQTPNGNIAAIVQNGAGMLVLTNTTLKFNQVVASNGAVWFASAGAVPTNNGANSIILAKGGGVAIGGGISSVTNLLSGGLLTNNAAGGTLSLMTGGISENISMGVYSNLYLGAAPGQTATFLGTLTPASGTTNYLIGGGGGMLIIGNPNVFTDANTLTNRAVVIGNAVTSTVQVLGPQSYAGGTTVTNATLIISADNNLGYGNLTLQNGTTLQITNTPNNSFNTIKTVALPSGTVTLDIGGSATGTFYGAISGVGTVNKNGTGTLALAGAFNPAAAGANLNNVNAGTLWLMGGSTLNNNNGASDLNLLAGTTMQVDSNATAYMANLRVGNSAGTAYYNQGGGVVTASSYFVVSSPGGGSVGIATMTGGSLVAGSNGITGGVKVGGIGIGTLNITNATLTTLGNAVAQGIFNVAMAAASTGTVNQGSGSVINLTSAGGGLVLAPATNTMATYNLGAGGLLITPKISSGYTGGGTWVAAFNFMGGTLLANANNTSFMQGLSLVNVSNLNGGAYLDSSNFVIAVSNNMSGTGVLNKQGLGMLILAGSNTYSGMTVINTGTVWFTSTQAISGVSAPVASNITINSAGTLAAVGAYSNVTSWLGSGRIVTSSAGALGLISNSTENIAMGAFNNLSLGVVAFSNAAYSGTLTPNGTTYRLAAGYGGTLTMMNANAVTGNTSLVVSGPGVVTLAASNTYFNGTLINSGATLLLSNNASAGPVNGSVTANGTLVAGYALDEITVKHLNGASTGVLALGANNTNDLDLSVAGAGQNLANLSLGAAGGTWTNSGLLTPNGTSYRLGGGGGTLVITNDNALSVAGYNLVAFGSGTGGNLVLTGTNTYGGGTLINSLGTATVATVSLGSGAVTNNGVLMFGLNSGTFTNTISGSGVTMQNANTLTLAGSNTGAGGYVLINGAAGNNILLLTNATGPAISGNLTLSRIGSGAAAIAVRTLTANQLSSNSVLTLSQNCSSNVEVRFSMQGNNQVIGGLNSVQSQAGALIVESATDNSTNLPATLTIITAAGSNYAYASSTAYLRNAATSSNAALSIVKDGLGTQLLGGPQITYTGPTLVNNGVLALSNTTGFASGVTVNGGQLLLASAGATTVNKTVITNNVNDGLGFTGGNAFTIGGLAGTGGITLWSQTGGSVMLSIGSNNLSSTYSGILSDAGPGNYFQGSLVKVGTGTLTLNNNNTYNGRTFIDNGTLKAAMANVLPTRTPLILGQGVFDSAGFNQTVGSLSGGSSVTNSTAAMATVTVGTDNSSATYSGIISGANGLTKVGSGTLTLLNTNNYTGATVVNSGTLQLSPPLVAGLREGRVYGAFDTTSPNPGTSVQLSMRYANIADSGSAYPATGGAWVDNSTYIYSGNIFNNSGSNVTWTFAKNFDDSVLFKIDGITFINNGSYSNAMLTNVTLTTGAHTFELRLGQGGSGVGPNISGWWTSTTLGFGYDTQGRGATNIANYLPLIDPGNGSLLGITITNVLPAATALSIASGATLDLNGAIQSVGSLSDSGGVGGLVTNTSLVQSLFTVGTANSDATFSGNINGLISLAKVGTGTQTLINTNIYSGGTLISGGTLQLGDGTAHNGSVVGNITNNANLTCANPNPQTFSGVISGSGTVTKNAAGTLTLTGSNTYTGTTTINAGTLLINGTQTSGGLINVLNGGTLGGTGMLGSVSVYTGGVFSPGNGGVGTQMTGMLSMTGGLFRATLVNSASFSQIVVTNTLLISTAPANYLELVLGGYTPQANATYLIIKNDSLVPWTSSGNGLFTLSDQLNPGLVLTNGMIFQAVGGTTSATNTFRINYDFDAASSTFGTGNDILLSVIPEPTTANLLLMLLLAGGTRRLVRRVRERTQA